jgi:hypothetical protein
MLIPIWDITQKNELNLRILIWKHLQDTLFNEKQQSVKHQV